VSEQILNGTSLENTDRRQIKNRHY